MNKELIIDFNDEEIDYNMALESIRALEFDWIEKVSCQTVLESDE